MKIKSPVLYESASLPDLLWQAHFQYEKDFLIPMMSHGTEQFIKNVTTEMKILQSGETLFPVTVNETEYDNSYVCSPFTACITYAKEELFKLNNKPLENILGFILNLSGWLFKKSRINQVVCINNWLFSTNLYPDWQGEDVHEITEYLTKQYNDHVIMFRSLNEVTNQQLLSRFRKVDYIFIASRQIYLIDDHCRNFLNKHNNKIDFNLLNKTSYQVINHAEITPEDYPRIVDLYNKLYLEKYSYHNPQFSVEFIKLCCEKKLLIMQGLRNQNGTLDAINGYFERNGVVTMPLVGYDTALPRSLGLYRMLMALVIKYCVKKKYLLNFSSGAADFKRQRGARPVIEYSAIYIRHLSLRQRLTWRILEKLLNNIGIPLMQKYQL